MGGFAAALPIIGTIATVGSAVVGAGASIYSGFLQKQADDQTAKNLENQGKADFASAQRDALQKDIETKYLLSSQQAQAAGSGAGAGSDAPSVVRMMTETAKRGEQAQENALYSGYERQNAYTLAAEGTRASGGMSFLGGLAGGLGRVISGAGSYARDKQMGLVY